MLCKLLFVLVYSVGVWSLCVEAPVSTTTRKREPLLFLSTHLKPIGCNNQSINKEELPLKSDSSHFFLFVLLDATIAQLATLEAMSMDERAGICHSQNGQVCLVEVHCGWIVQS